MPPPPNTFPKKTNRYKQAEQERQLAEDANRLFKLEFGDKIERQQAEMEQLKRERYVVLLVTGTNTAPYTGDWYKYVIFCKLHQYGLSNQMNRKRDQDEWRQHFFFVCPRSYFDQELRKERDQRRQRLDPVTGHQKAPRPQKDWGNRKVC